MIVEPSSDHRQMAIAYWQTFQAFLGQGFSEEQSFTLTREFMAMALGPQFKGGK